MAESSLPGNVRISGERTSSVVFRRSSNQYASTPSRSLSLHERAARSQEDAEARILFSHPSVRIYTFKPPTDALQTLDKTKETLPDADYPIDAIEVLPWRSRREILAANGPMQLEKVQGSGWFLKSGSIIQVIMKNSQCWCVDGESKFVLRVRKLVYLRIELPCAEQADKAKIEDFKQAMDKVLKYEKTPCPFIRAFSVSLADDAITPRRRGIWKRRESDTPAISDVETPIARDPKATRTMSMRAMPPTSFPTRSRTQIISDRPRTASTPITTHRPSFPEVRTESPVSLSSDERHDSESDRPGSSAHSETDESERESSRAPTLRSPLNNVSNVSNVSTTQQRASKDSYSNVRARAATLERRLSNTYRISSPVRDPVVIESPVATVQPLRVENATAITRDGAREDVSPHSLSRTTRVSSPLLRPPLEHQIVPKKSIDDPFYQQLLHETRREVPSPRPILEDPIELPETPIQQSVKLLNSFIKPPSAPSSVSSSRRLSSDTRCDHCGGSRVTSPSLNGTSVDGDYSARISPLLLERDVIKLDMPGTETGIEQAIPKNVEATPQARDDDVLSTISSDSFHTTLSDDEDEELESSTTKLLPLMRPTKHRRELSELTIIPDTPAEDAVKAEHSPQSPSHVPVLESTEPAFSNAELRRRLKHRRSLSPLPPSSILEFRQAQEALSKTILQKAAVVAVVKPIQAVVFVAHVLVRIAQGATLSELINGELFQRPGMRRTASGTFERGRPRSTNSEDEDDYGNVVRPGATHDTGTPASVD